MAKLVLVDVVKPILLSMRKCELTQNEILRVFEGADKHCLGIKQVLLDFLAEEQEQAQPKIKVLADELDTIFTPLNKEICGVCKKHECNKVAGRNVGCCSQCYTNQGHFSRSDDFVSARQTLGKLIDKYGWDHVYGFLGSNGCMLPREYRSNTCLSHMCDNLRSALSPEQRDRVEEIVRRIRKLRESINAPLM